LARPATSAETNGGKLPTWLACSMHDAQPGKDAVCIFKNGPRVFY
jgi:hypothetical protein